MLKSTWKLFGTISVIVTILLIVISRPLGLGYVVGVGMCALLYKRNETYWGDVFDAREKVGYGYFGHYLINLLCMAVPMILAARHPHVLNIFTVALGLLMIKITVTLETVLPKKGD